MMTPISIVPLGDHPTIGFAAMELQRYLAQATGRAVTINPPHHQQSAIRLGLSEELPGVMLPPPTQPDDRRFDDAFTIAVSGAQGSIAGANPRSVLLAVYRYLHLLGLRWVRPGRDGEYIPAIELETTSIHIAERPSYRHRGICIEGAVSYEHVRDLIDWMPKVGMNAYFVQFREGFTFFDRWYSHMGNPYRQAEGFSVEQARAIVTQIASEVKLRDMLYHAVGHGWTCEPFGIAGLGWEYPPEPVPPEAQPYLALVNGRRELWESIPLNTSLCYGNTLVRQIMTDAVVSYAQQNPHVDLLHFWLADGTNNQCECPDCVNIRPSDLYMLMLNELDRKLSAQQLELRVVFLAYFDLLWPPEREHIQNPDRFVLMFAPITRTYSATFSTEQALPELPPFVRNRLSFPRDIEQNLAFLRAWQAHLQAHGQQIDSFDFDYHLMWDHYRDPALMQIASVVHDDLQLLTQIDMHGFISCQVQRAFFPTGLPMALMGWALWDAGGDLQERTSDYFAAAFGPHGPQAQAYLTTLSELFDPSYLRNEKPGSDRQAAAALQQVPAVVSAFLPTIAENMSGTQACWARSWQYLNFHAELVVMLADALRERALGNHENAQAAWSILKQRAWQLEEQLHPVLDTYLFTRVYDGIFASHS